MTASAFGFAGGLAVSGSVAVTPGAEVTVVTIETKASIGVGALHVRLLDSDQRPEAERVLARELENVRLEPDPAALSAPCADADRAAEAVAELSRSGIRIADFSLGQPSLDEVFLALTGHPAEDETPEQPIQEEQAA